MDLQMTWSSFFLGKKLFSPKREARTYHRLWNLQWKVEDHEGAGFEYRIRVLIWAVKFKFWTQKTSKLNLLEKLNKLPIFAGAGVTDFETAMKALNSTSHSFEGTNVTPSLQKENLYKVSA